jgi:EmrB/QacA subfamily drug resistance transporter
MSSVEAPRVSDADQRGTPVRPAEPASPDPRRWAALAVLALVQLMIVLDQTVVNIALPSIQRDLGAGPTQLAWVVNGYLVAAGGLLMLGGRLGDLLGRRRMFVIGTVLFATASLLCGTAVNDTVLIVSRFVQGAGEALASPAALALVALLFTGRTERAKAFGIWGGISGIGSVLGVVLSGVIVDLVSWRWIFLINIPVAIIALVLVPRYVRAAELRSGGRRADWLGAVLVTAGSVLIIKGLLATAEPGASVRSVGLPLVLGALGLAAFVVVQRRSANPLVPPRFFCNRTRVVANLSTVFLTSAMAAMFFLVTLYVQDVLGYTPLQSGLAYLPFCVAFGVGLGMGAQLSARAGLRLTIVAAFLVGAAGMVLLARVDVDSSFVGTLLPATVVIALGLALGLPALQNAGMHQLSDGDAGLGGGVQTAVQQLGSALGLAVLASIAIAAADRAGAGNVAAGAVAGYRLAFLVMAAVLVAGAVVTATLLRVDDRKPDDTLQLTGS